MVLVGVLLSPFNIRGRSSYNGLSNTMYCKTPEACRHEIGHLMDDDLGYPSHRVGYGDALRLLLYYNLRYDILDNYTMMILCERGVLTYDLDFSVIGGEAFSSPQSELYANMYLLADGNIDALPESLQQFYSREQKYIDLYNCLTQNPRFSLCGTSIYIREK